MADRFATVQARAALAGIVLAATEDDHGRPLFVASRWAMTKAFCSLDEVEAWMDDIACMGEKLPAAQWVAASADGINRTSTRSAKDGSSLAQRVEA